MTKARQHGLSLIELMITVAVIVTLAVVGGPPLADTLRNNRLTAQSNELNAGLTRARTVGVNALGKVVRPVDTNGNGTPQVLSGGDATCP
jgi:prepilin-type N-terminal cleavage/methylation domain-containing protein